MLPNIHPDIDLMHVEAIHRAGFMLLCRTEQGSSVARSVQNKANISRWLRKDCLHFKKVIYALIALEASLFQALGCLIQWPYLLMH